MNQLRRCREIMAWVRKRSADERILTTAGLALELDYAQTTIHRIVTRLYPECFDVEPYVGVTLTGNWPGDIAFDWETLEALEYTDPVEKFRAPKTAKSAKAAINYSEAQYGLEAWNTIITKPQIFTVEHLVDQIEREQYEDIVTGLEALSSLLRARGPLPKSGYFHQTTQLHFKQED